MKFDATLNVANLREVAALTTQIESIGFDGVWTSETTHNPFLPLTLAAAHSTHLELGTSIAVAFPRSPMVTAQIAWDLAEQADGRFILGLGTQVKAHIVRRFSSVWDSPGPRLRDYIMSLHAIWECFQKNRPLKYKGEFYEFSLLTPFFAPPPIAHPDIPIYIAGVNPYLCRLAGELCQGFHVHPFHTARYLKEVIIPNITQGAANVGRKREDVALTCAIFVVTGADDQAIESNKNSIKAQIAFYASTPSYGAVMQLHGWDAIAEQLTAMSKQNRWLEMTDLITDEMLHEFAVVAPHDQLATRVRERYAGLLDRISYYFPFEIGKDEALWRDGVKVLSDKSE